MTLTKQRPTTTTRLSDDFVQGYADREREGGNPLERSFNGLGYVVFKRTYARRVDGEDRTEEWFETVRRVCDGAAEIVGDYTDVELERLFDHVWSLRAFPSGRALWQLGTENQRRLGADSLVNCWFVDIREPEDLVWMFERLMLGGGVGFSVTNSRDLGRVVGGTVRQQESGDVDYVVPDSRQGWAGLLRKALQTLFHGGTLSYSVREVRPAGAPIKTFGGVASGPGILVEGIGKISDLVSEARGGYLTSVQLLDIANIIGAIVVSGNVRRSAQIALGDPSDGAFLRSKRWDLGIPNHRAMSNNSVYVQDFGSLGEDFWAGYEGKGEPFGMVNLDTSRGEGRTGERLPDDSIRGFNPCGEIALGHRESCNLAELVVPHFTSYDQMKDAAFLLYRLQKAIAAMPYLDEVSNDITHRNMRLGLSVGGVWMAKREQLDWLDPLYSDLREEDRRYSSERGWPESVRLTTVQPSGTKSLLAGVTPGAHPAFARFHIRRVRLATNDPTMEYIKARGYPHEYERRFDGTENRDTTVVEFPCEFPYGTLAASQVGYKDMLKMQEFLQGSWADNAVSITVYYDPEDLSALRSYLADNWGTYKSVSFLLKNGHGFDQAPLEGISIHEYERRLGEIDMTREVHLGDTTNLLLDSDCEGGSCPIR